MILLATLHLGRFEGIFTLTPPLILYYLLVALKVLARPDPFFLISVFIFAGRRNLVSDSMKEMEDLCSLLALTILPFRQNHILLASRGHYQPTERCSEPRAHVRVDLAEMAKTRINPRYRCALADSEVSYTS